MCLKQELTFTQVLTFTQRELWLKALTAFVSLLTLSTMGHENLLAFSEKHIPIPKQLVNIIIITIA